MSRNSVLEASTSSHMRPGPTKHKSKKVAQQLVKMATKMTSGTHVQWAMLVVDLKGRVTIETSEAFQSHREAWFHPQMIKEATDSTMALCNELRARRRVEMDQNGIRLDARVDDGAVMEDEEEFEDDAEHDDDIGMHRQQDEHGSQGMPKHMYGFPELHQSLPSMYGSGPQYARKRPLQTPKPSLRKKRRSSGRSPPMQRSDSTSGESTNMNNNSMQTLKPLMIADYDAVTTFFETRFRQLQQLTCKVVAKAWIKVIEPKKQSNFPYNRGEESKPAWWPNGARHKEPDHLMKPERLLLLMTMLRCRKVPISKLENATSEVSANIEECRIGLLSEIYRVAKMEERYIDGVLPENSCVYVAPSADKIMSNAKTQSPKPVVENSDTSPVATSGGLSLNSNMMATSAGSEMPRVGSLEIQSRHGSKSDASEMGMSSRAQQQHFSMARTNIQPIHTSMSYSSSPLYSSTQGNGDDYLESPHHPPTNYYYSRSSISYPPNQVQPITRRTQSVSSHTPSSSQYWLPNQSPLYYTPPSQSHQPQSPHHTAHGAHSIGILPPPTRPQNSHHQSHNPLAPHHSHDMSGTVGDDRSAQYDPSRMTPQHMTHNSVTFSELLEGTISERPYDLGSVSGGVGDDIVGLGGGRNTGGSILNSDKMPHA